MDRLGDVLSDGMFDWIRRHIEEAKAKAAASRERLATEGMAAAQEFDATLPPEIAKERPLETMVEAVLGKKPEER